MKTMNRSLPIGVLFILGINGCGSDSGNSNKENDTEKTIQYQISDYTPLAGSTSIEGTWVTIAHGTERHTIAQGDWDEGSFSIKRFQIIRKHDGRFQLAKCDSGFSNITHHGDAISIEDFPSQLNILNNNRITGTVNTNEENGDYSKYTLELIKVSNNTGSLGNVSTKWSGSENQLDTDQEVFAYCAQQIDEVDEDGLDSLYSIFKIGVRDVFYETEVIDGTRWGDPYGKLEVQYRTGSAILAGTNNDSVNIDYTESSHSFTGAFMATFQDGDSVNVTTSIQLPAQ